MSEYFESFRHFGGYPYKGYGHLETSLNVVLLQSKLDIFILTNSFQQTVN